MTKSLYESHQSDKADCTNQIKPLLNKHCISGHGGVKKIDCFSLLSRSVGLAKTKSGKPAMMPFQRFTITDIPTKHEETTYYI